VSDYTTIQNTFSVYSWSIDIFNSNDNVCLTIRVMCVAVITEDTYNILAVISMFLTALYWVLRVSNTF